ncbi:organic cation transporter protein isoform X2 [Schistocerca cancellata]|uniref:organic cation transporter protein isoform X2 n=1 Tax=Schistocerca cancellata TaxID=274614 RepID=UPI0021183D8C|nr:organic cation transporter protein isoform X2 [Schistocerca cancellata]
MRSAREHSPLNDAASAAAAVAPPTQADDDENAEVKKMDFDDVLVEIGEFGRYQILNYFLICLPVFFGAANSLSYVFTSGIPTYRCWIPECDNITNPVYDASWVSTAVPPGKECIRYAPYDNNTSDGTCPSNFSKKEISCDHFVFKDDEWTIVNEWDLTCPENLWKLSLVGTVHFAGILIGSSIFGLLADKFGRKIILILCILLMAVSGVAQALSTTYIAFQVFIFINALGCAGVYPPAFIIGVELVGKNLREMSGIVLNYFYALGEAAVALVAYLCRDWVRTQLVISAPAAIFAVYYWIIPESVRWLLVNNRTKAAEDIIKKAAMMNKVVLSDHLLKTIDMQKGQLTVSKRNPEEKTIWEAIVTVMKTKKLLLRSLYLFFIWAANAFVYYGLSINSTSLGGNKYLNFALVALVEIPGYTISWIAMNRFGRRSSLVISMLMCSATCLGAAFIPQDVNWAVVLLFLLGKLGITCSFGIVVVYTAELYPTVMRSAGVGASSTISRLGAMVAPFVPLLGTYVEPLPLLLFGVVSLLAGVLSLLLPETLGRKLPDTVEDAQNL